MKKLKIYRIRANQLINDLGRVLLLMVCTIILGISCEKQDDITVVRKGCTDTLSLNYDPEAEQDNGSCIYERRDQLVGRYRLETTCGYGTTTLDTIVRTIVIWKNNDNYKEIIIHSYKCDEDFIARIDYDRNPNNFNFNYSYFSGSGSVKGDSLFMKSSSFIGCNEIAGICTSKGIRY